MRLLLIPFPLVECQRDTGLIFVVAALAINDVSVLDEKCRGSVETTTDSTYACQRNLRAVLEAVRIYSKPSSTF